MLNHIEGAEYNLNFVQISGSQLKLGESLLTDGVKNLSLSNKGIDADWTELNYSNCTLLTSISFDGGKSINVNCEILPNKLNNLTMINTKIQNINNFSGMNQVTSLDVRNNSISDLSFLQDYFKYDSNGKLYCDSPITTLNLQNNVLSDMTTININGTTVTNYTSYFLSLMPNLKTVKLSGNEDLKTFNYLTDNGFINNGNNFSK